MTADPDAPATLAAPDDGFVLGEVVGASGALRDPVAMYLATLTSKDSQKSMFASLRVLAGILEKKEKGSGGDVGATRWEHLRAEHTTYLRAELQRRGYQLATIDRHLVALRGVLKNALRLGLMPAEAYARAVDLPRPRGTRGSPHREVSNDDVAKLFAACASDALGTRDRAMLVLLFAGGLRRAEAAALTWQDYDARTRTLSLRGKGDKARTVPLGRSADALASWIALRGTDSGPFLLAFTGQRALTRNRLSANGLYHALRELASRAGVAVHPHDARHKRITELLESGVDLLLTARFAGHARVDTTKRYDRRSDAALRAAIDGAPCAVGRGE